MAGKSSRQRRQERRSNLQWEDKKVDDAAQGETCTSEATECTSKASCIAPVTCSIASAEWDPTASCAPVPANDFKGKICCFSLLQEPNAQEIEGAPLKISFCSDFQPEVSDEARTSVVVRNTFLNIDEPKDESRHRRCRSEPVPLSVIEQLRQQEADAEEECGASSTNASGSLAGSCSMSMSSSLTMSESDEAFADEHPPVTLTADKASRRKTCCVSFEPSIVEQESEGGSRQNMIPSLDKLESFKQEQVCVVRNTFLVIDEPKDEQSRHRRSRSEPVELSIIEQAALCLELQQSSDDIDADIDAAPAAAADTKDSCAASEVSQKLYRRKTCCVSFEPDLNGDAADGESRRMTFPCASKFDSAEHQQVCVVRNTFLDFEEPKQAEFRRRRSEPCAYNLVSELAFNDDSASVCSTDTSLSIPSTDVDCFERDSPSLVGSLPSDLDNAMEEQEVANPTLWPSTPRFA